MVRVLYGTGDGFYMITQSGEYVNCDRGGNVLMPIEELEERLAKRRRIGSQNTISVGKEPPVQHYSENDARESPKHTGDTQDTVKLTSPHGIPTSTKAQNTIYNGNITASESQSSVVIQPKTVTCSEGKLPKIWNKSHEDGLELVKRVHPKLIDQVVPDLREMLVDVMPDLWARLKAQDVVTVAQINGFKNNATPEKAVENFLEYLNRGPMWRFHGFLKCLADTNNDHVVKELGFDPKLYI